jgi:general secretion pathway protein F
MTTGAKLLELKKFAYQAVTSDGASVRDTVTASSREEALRRLTRENLTVTRIDEAIDAPTGGLRLNRDKVDDETRVLILQQMALLTRAGVDLLEALEIIATGQGPRAGAELRAVAQGLRRGERLSEAFGAHMQGYPRYVEALISVGEASGRLDQVLEDGARQLAFEDRIRKDITTAMTYPAFLLTAGAGAVGFLFYEVVPRFAAMIGDSRDNLTGLAAAVIGGGEFFRANAILVLIALGAIIFAVAGALTRPQGRRFLYDVGLATPVVRDVLRARERATWARIMGFSLSNGVAILDACDLAAGAAPEGPFRRSLNTAARGLRAGKAIDETFAETGAFSPLDLGLMRAGQRSGALALMMGFIAERHENTLRDSIKRATTLVEPLAIGFVAIVIGMVAVGLVTAMTSIYDTVL